MRQLKRTTLLVMAGVCLAAAGCGSDEEGAPIPADSASTLQSQLDSIEGRVNGGVGGCEDVTGERDPNTTVVDGVIGNLPGDVDEDVRQALVDSFDRLFQLVEDRCAELRSEEESQSEDQPLVPDTPVDPEAEPEPTTPETTPTDTGEETVPEEPVDPPAEEPPADEGDDGGGTIAPGGG